MFYPPAPDKGWNVGNPLLECVMHRPLPLRVVQVRGLTDQEWQKAVSMAFESRIVLLGYTGMCCFRGHGDQSSGHILCQFVSKAKR